MFRAEMPVRVTCGVEVPAAKGGCVHSSRSKMPVRAQGPHREHEDRRLSAATHAAERSMRGRDSGRPAGPLPRPPGLAGISVARH